MTQTHPGDVLAPQKTAPAAPPVDHSPNPEAELARRFVTETNQHIYLTGRAGTGKTTFLHRLRQHLRKSYVVVAPTGVAAINAKGTTIHSQMQLPFGMLTPERMNGPEGRRHLAKAKEQVLRRIDLLIIDEISMVRADVMDAMDIVLQRVRRNSAPFGGVQLLLIGDLHQLPPVVKHDEERAMAERYQTPYFFSSRALQQAGLVTIELLKVYRQSDGEFVQLLGEVRANRMTPDVLRKLNSRYRAPEGTGDSSEANELAGYITLTSHRRTADNINTERLAATAGKSVTYTADVKGTFPESSYPTDERLELKVGAQVMFVKNDPDGRFHNGKIGTVTKLEEALVTVDCGEDGGIISTGKIRWDNARYSLNDSTKEVSTQVAGSFDQVPLRLAWAITIHKSQGLTFDRVVIDAASAFAHGQVYVALSRSRSFEGIVLRTEIESRAVRTDREVNNYTEEQRDLHPGETQLAAARKAYRAKIIGDAFEFRDLVRAVDQFRRHGLVDGRSYPGLTDAELDAMYNFVTDKCQQVAINFGQQLQTVLAEAELDREPVPVPERCRQAAGYFKKQLTKFESEHLDALDLETDNKDVGLRGDDLMAEVRRELALAQAAVSAVAAETFDPNAILTQRARISLNGPERKSASSGAASSKVAYPLLYAMLTDWRAKRAKEDEVSISEVLSAKAMRALTAARPVTAKQLLFVQGIGATTARRHGAELLKIISEYAEMEARGELSPKPVPGAKSATAAGALVAGLNATSSLTLSMFRSGQSVQEIADGRSYTTSTIYGHLAAAAEAGATDADAVIEAADYEKIVAYLEDHDGDMTGSYGFFDGRLDSGLLKLGRAIWRRSQPRSVKAS